MNKREKLPSSTLAYMLLALIPYSRPNMKLTFKPAEFFKDLDRIDRVKEANARNAYYRAVRLGLVEIGEDNIPRLTDKGKRKIQPYVAKKLGDNARLMVTFDIPESEKFKRNRLRLILRECGFEQKQKSVWVTDYDHRDLLDMEIQQQELLSIRPGAAGNSPLSREEFEAARHHIHTGPYGLNEPIT